MFPPALESSWKNFRPPSELNRATPRETALTGGGIALIFLCAAFVLLAIGISTALRIEANRQQRELALLMAQGRLAPATVTRKWRTGGKSPENMASFSFDVGGRPYTGRAPFARAQWDQLTPDSPLDVRYLPSDPSLNFPVIAPLHPAPWWTTLLIVPVFLLAPALILGQISRERALVRDGTPAPGIVTRNRRGKTNRVEYDFVLLGGGRATGVYQHRYVGAGALVCVIYNPENPRRNILYPAHYVKARAAW